MKNIILKTIETIFYVLASLIMGGVLFFMLLVGYWVILLNPQPTLINFPIWFRVSMYVLLLTVWGISAWLMYKENKNKTIKRT